MTLFQCDVADHAVTPASHPLSYGRKRHGKLVSSPHNKALSNSSPVNHSPAKGNWSATRVLYFLTFKVGRRISYICINIKI